MTEPRAAATPGHGSEAGRAVQIRLPDDGPDPVGAPYWILNWGLGVDSTAILVRLFQLLEVLDRKGVTGRERDEALAARLGLPGFRLDRLVVMVALLGSEWPLTGELAQREIVPRLARWRIRLVQVARSGPAKADGVTTLDDSTTPTHLHLEGDYTLFMESVRSGTIPQLGGVRKCSLKHKGEPLDAKVAEIVGGSPFYQIMGFEAGESSRCDRDARADTAQRTGVYPLRAWGWTREVCERFIRRRIGVHWPKSACLFCVFALASEAGRERVLRMLAAAPELAWEPLLMERIAVTLNPAQTLMADGSLHDLMQERGLHRALEMFEGRVEAMDWSLVEVRRPMNAQDGDSSRRGGTARDLTVHRTGPRAAMLAALGELAAVGHRDAYRSVPADPRYPRVWLHPRAATFPTLDHLFAVVPAYVATKQAPAFPKLWAAVTAATGYRPPVLPGVGRDEQTDLLAGTASANAVPATPWQLFHV